MPIFCYLCIQFSVYSPKWLLQHLLLIMPQLEPEHFGSLKSLLLDIFPFFPLFYSVLICAAHWIHEYTIALVFPALFPSSQRPCTANPFGQHGATCPTKVDSMHLKAGRELVGLIKLLGKHKFLIYTKILCWPLHHIICSNYCFLTVCISWLQSQSKGCIISCNLCILHNKQFHSGGFSTRFARTKPGCCGSQQGFIGELAHNAGGWLQQG